MASPQLENGFIRISNEIFEKIYQSDFTMREYKIIMAVIRFTYGFNRKDAQLSLRFLANATNIFPRHVQTTVKNLIAKNVLIIHSDRQGIRSREIQLNKDYDTWNLTADHVRSTSVTDSVIDQISQLPKMGNDQIGDSSVPKSVNTRDDQFGQLTKTVNDQNSNTSDTDSVISSIDQKSDKERQKTTLNTNSCVYLIPDELKNLKGFVDIWKDWTDYRNEIKKPLSPIAIKVQLGKLVSFQGKGYNILEIINTSISNSWLDFYEPRENIYSSPGKGDKQKKEYIYDKLKDLNPDLPGWM